MQRSHSEMSNGARAVVTAYLRRAHSRGAVVTAARCTRMHSRNMCIAGLRDLRDLRDLRGALQVAQGIELQGPEYHRPWVHDLFTHGKPHC